MAYSVSVPGLAGDGVAPPPAASAPPGSSNPGSGMGYPDRGPTQYLPGPGQISLDHAGSYDEWRTRVVADLLNRYLTGQGQLGSDDPELGRPDPNDYNSAASDGNGTYSWATVQFIERFVDKYGTTSEYIKTTYGPPPTRRATYAPDPNSAAGITDRNIQADRDAREWETGENRAQRDWETGENRAQRDWETGENAADRAARQALQDSNNAFIGQENAADRTFQSGQAELDRALAREREANETGRIKMQIDSNEKLALMDDITRRYIAEGDWGMQRYVTDEQEKGLLTRLELTLGLQREQMAQDAVAEANRHHETMTGLVMRVAEYDTSLAGQPVNWLKYASWLANRGQVVDGLNLAMAAELVPDEAIGPEELAASGMPGSNIAAIQTYEEQMMNGQGAQQTVTAPTAGQNAATAQAPVPSTQGTTSAATAQQPYTYKGVDLNNRNYSDLFNQIIGLNPNAPVNGVDNSQAAIQGTLNSLDTTGYGAQTTNPGGGGFDLNGQKFAFNADGTQNDIRKFAKLDENQQMMHAAAVDATGNNFTRFLGDMKKTKPKGGQLAGATSYG